MNTFLKKFILTLTIFLLITGPVYAEPVKNIENIQANIEKLDNNIETVMKKIDDNNKQILDTENDIKVIEQELKDVENNIDNEKKLFNSRIRAMYINGFDNYLHILLQSKDVKDLISNSDAVKRVVDLDASIIEKYKNKKNLISTKKETLLVKSRELAELKKNNEKELEQLNNAKEEQKKLLFEVAGYSEDPTLVADALKYIENLKKDLSTPAFAAAKSKLSSDNVIAYASDFLGTPYVWGGTSPKPGFDCSGFVQYVYEHFGVHIGRTTYDQIKDGTEVPLDKLKPGDLVFFGTKKDPHHVGMYIGFGAYIHAPHTGDFIKISPLNRSDYLTARRVMNP